MPKRKHYPKNFGLHIEKPRPEDYRFGASPVVEEEINPSGDWSLWRPQIEYQRYPEFDTMGCVSFSALNCLETMHKQKYGEEINRDDRYTVVSSGTTKTGNWMTKVGDSIRKEHGTIEQGKWPFDGKKWDDYYQSVPQELLSEGLEWLKYYKVQYEFVSPPFAENLMQALKTAPLQITVHAWEKPVNGIYQRTEKQNNHAVMLFNYKEGEYWEILDTYDKDIKWLAWDFLIGFAFKYSIDKIVQPVKLNETFNKFMKLVRVPQFADVYFVCNGIRHPIHDGLTYENYFGDWDLIEEITAEELEKYKLGDKIVGPKAFLDGVMSLYNNR